VQASQRSSLAAIPSKRKKAVVRFFIAAMATSALLTQTAYAQAIPGQSPKEKAAQELKKEQEKDTDKAYSSALKRMPNANKPVDPWGNIRAPSESVPAGAKKTRVLVPKG
jgi:hypothetical protein